MGQAALSNEKQSALFLCLSQSPSPKQPHLPSPPQGRALKKSPFFMTKTENAYDL